MGTSIIMNGCGSGIDIDEFKGKFRLLGIF